MSDAIGRNGDDFWLTDEDIQQFHRDGYVTSHAVLSEVELALIEPVFDSFIRGEVSGMGRDFCDMSGPADRRFADFSLVNAMSPRLYRREASPCIWD
jgi:hypothetical protein